MEMKSKYQQSHEPNIVAEFNQYKEKSIEQKQFLRKQVEKCRQHLNTFTEKLQKKYNAKLIQERHAHEKKVEKIQKNYKRNIEQLKDHIEEKNSSLRELGELIEKVQFQKKGIIQMHTKMLQEMAKDYEKKQQNKSPHSHSYRQLLQMYQYLIEENNQLKKEIYLHGIQQNNNQSHKKMKEIKQDVGKQQSSKNEKEKIKKVSKTMVKKRLK